MSVDDQDKEKLRKIRAEIDAFDKKCFETQYTDTGVVWELLYRWRETLTGIIERQ